MDSNIPAYIATFGIICALLDSTTRVALWRDLIHFINNFPFTKAFVVGFGMWGVMEIYTAIHMAIKLEVRKTVIMPSGGKEVRVRVLGSNLIHHINVDPAYIDTSKLGIVEVGVLNRSLLMDVAWGTVRILAREGTTRVVVGAISYMLLV